jgi:hypothetical protein
MEEFIAPAITLLLGILGTFFIQRNRSSDKEERDILERRKDDASVTIAAIEQWQKIVTAQGDMQASQARDMTLLREESSILRQQGQECEVRCRRLEDELKTRDERIDQLERRLDERNGLTGHS